MLALDALESIEEFIKADTVFEVGEESVHGDARIEEARRAAQALGIAPNWHVIGPGFEHERILPRRDRGGMSKGPRRDSRGSAFVEGPSEREWVKAL